MCKDCDGSSLCDHGRRKDRCNECDGAGMCEHGRRKTCCKDCGGSQICEHGKRKDLCKDCGGSQICEHDKVKSQCWKCEDNLCEHRRLKKVCKECGGNQICNHGKRKTYCGECGGSAICISKATIGCKTIGNRKLNGYCSHCFVNLFPDDPRALTVKRKSKEIQVMTYIYIYSKYDGFKNDKPFYVDLEGGCCETKRRIDLRKLIGNTMLCIEVGENQHKRYIKENERNRYDDLFIDFSGKYIFIRYNP